MTNQEAIENLKAVIKILEWEHPLDYAVAIEKGVEAIQKQIPKAVEEVTPPYGENGLRFLNSCPNCKYNLTKMLICHEFVTPNYCLCCGQALDWSGEE